MIVGFCGAIGAGKTTAALRLTSAHGFTRVRFAQPLKSALRGLLASAGVPEAEAVRMVDGDLKEAPSAALCGRTPRHAMQTLGTEWGRDCIGPDFWASIWQGAARAILAAGGRVVVDDLRFPNEEKALRALGGALIRIDRAGVGASTHASEGQPLAPDATLANDGDIDALRLNVDAAVLPLIEQRRKDETWARVG